MKLYAYEIVNDYTSRSKSDFFEKLKDLDKYDDRKIIEQRLFPSPLNNNEKDVLIYYEVIDNVFFGVVKRFTSISDNLFNYDCITETSWKKIGKKGKENNVGNTTKAKYICLRTYFFMVSDRHIVITLPPKRMSEFCHYINKLLEEHRDGVYKTNPYKFSNIGNLIDKNIELIIEKNDYSPPPLKKGFSDNFISGLINLVPKSSPTNFKLSFNSENDAKHAISNFLPLLNDDDSVSIIYNGKKKRVNEIYGVKKVSNNPNTIKELRNEMVQYLNELEL